MKRNKGAIFVVSAPSGAGKTTLCSRIREEDRAIRQSVSYTTRQPRVKEKHGEDYFFVSEPAFRKKIDRGDFVEWAEVHGNLYGTDRRQLERIIRSGDDVLLDIDTQGARQIRKAYPACVFIFILPPSMGELRRRLEGRKSNSPEDMERRLRNAVREIGEYKIYDYVIVNDSLPGSLDQLRSVIVAERLRSSRRDPAWIRNHILRR